MAECPDVPPYECRAPELEAEVARLQGALREAEEALERLREFATEYTTTLRFCPYDPEGCDDHDHFEPFEVVNAERLRGRIGGIDSILRRAREAQGGEDR